MTPATSVCSSFSSMVALCITSPTNNGTLDFNRPLKSAPDPNIEAMPI